jgi:hypothetical protein
MYDAVRRTRASFIRPHSSGDFESQFELDQWCEIARSNSLNHFYCYTKSNDLDWSDWDGLDNTTRIQSLGGLHDDLIDWSKPVAIVIEPGEREWWERHGWIHCDDDALAAFGCKRIIMERH